jgi:hypothetical protein
MERCKDRDFEVIYVPNATCRNILPRISPYVPTRFRLSVVKVTTMSPRLYYSERGTCFQS